MLYILLANIILTFTTWLWFGILFEKKLPKQPSELFRRLAYISLCWLLVSAVFYKITFATQPTLTQSLQLSFWFCIGFIFPIRFLAYLLHSSESKFKFVLSDTLFFCFCQIVLVLIFSW